MRLLSEVSRQKESEMFKQYLEDIRQNREYARGNQHEDDDDGLVRANIIHPELKKSVNEAYAKNPEISITPTEAVTPQRYDVWKQFGKTGELVLNSQFAPGQANLKKRAKQCVRAADTCGIGWLKVVYQRDIETDPVVLNRIKDVQDNIQRLDRLIMQTDENNPDEEMDSASLPEARKEELKQQLMALQEQVEVVRSEGIVMSVRPSEHVIFSGEVRFAEDIGEAEWICDEIYMEEELATDRFGTLPKKATRFERAQSYIEGTTKDADSATAVSAGNQRGRLGDDTAKVVCVQEVWRLCDNRIYTLIVGFNGFLKPPYTPKAVGERFHGLFPLYFDPQDGIPIPLALTSQLRELQDEHNTARTTFREHRERSVPFNVAHGQLNSKDVSALTNPGFMETIVLQSIPDGQRLSDYFTSVQHPPIDPAVYDTSHVRQDWEQITRRGDAARGTVAKPKTAKEAEILQANLAVDTNERADVVEDWIQEVSQYVFEICLSEMSMPMVQRIAGEDAVWPQMGKKDIFDMVQLEIRAGSTGKPDAAQDLDRWTKVLPEIRQTLQVVTELKANGNEELAETYVELTRETLRRFDERIDLDSLLPKTNDEDDMQKQQAAAQQQQEQQQQMALQMRQIISDIANKDADTIQKLADAEAKEVGQQMQIYMQMMQALTKPAAPQMGGPAALN